MSTELHAAVARAHTQDLPAPLHWRQLIVRPGLWLGDRQPIELGDGFGSPAQRQRTAHRIAFWRSLCGCQLAALAFLGAIGWQLWSRPAGQAIDGWAIARWLGMALLAALMVKLGVLALARGAAALELWWPWRAGRAGAPESHESWEQAP